MCVWAVSLSHVYDISWILNLQVYVEDNFILYMYLSMYIWVVCIQFVWYFLDFNFCDYKLEIIIFDIYMWVVCLFHLYGTIFFDLVFVVGNWFIHCCVFVYEWVVCMHHLYEYNDLLYHKIIYIYIYIILFWAWRNYHINIS